MQGKPFTLAEQSGLILSSTSEVANIEFTRAVLPLPREPEGFKTGFVTSGTGTDLTNLVMKFQKNCRLGMRPAKSMEDRMLDDMSVTPSMTPTMSVCPLMQSSMSMHDEELFKLSF
jgi:hypothetical protein